MGNPQVAPAGYPESVLDQLRKHLEEEQAKATELASAQAANKLEQDGLKKAIEAISKNSDEFSKDWQTLGKAYRAALDQAERQSRCVVEALGDLADGVYEAITSVDEAIGQQDETTAESEKQVAGLADLELRDAKRKAVRAQSAFDQLAFSALKDRVGQAEALIKKAGPLVNTTNDGNATAFAFLWLASKRLTETVLQSEIGSETASFDFPKSLAAYQLALLKANEQARDAAAKSLEAQAEFDKSKLTHESNLKQLAAERAGREAAAVAAAKAAVAPQPPAKPKPQPAMRPRPDDTAD